MRNSDKVTNQDQRRMSLLRRTKMCSNKIIWQIKSISVIISFNSILYNEVLAEVDFTKLSNIAWDRHSGGGIDRLFS